MNPEEIQTLVNMLSKFYVWELLIMLIAIGLTMFLKMPIKSQAVKLQEKYGVDKSMLTWITALIPYVLCFIMVFVLFWYRSGWASLLDSLNWTSIITETGLLGSGAIGIYEAIKKIVKGAKAIKEKKAIQKKTVAAENSASTSIYRVQKKEDK